MLLCVISILAQNNHAQKKAVTETVKPAEKSVLQNYIDISSLPMLEKQRFMRSSVSAEEKAALMKFHLAFQFVARPDLTAEQKALIWESITIIKADTYSRTDEGVQQEIVALAPRIKALFPGKDGFEIFGNIGASQEDVKILQKYRDLISLPSMAERKVKFGELSLIGKSNVWKVQMAIHLAGDFNLTKEQQEFLWRAIGLIKAEIYSITIDNPKDTELKNSLQKFTAEAIELFGREEGAKVFSMIGNELKVETGPNTEIVRPKCNCSHDSDWCWTRCAGNSCDRQSYCGFIWAWECTGTCLEN
jgi:hypothetical protein